MEEIINKPDSQFKDILNDLIDYTKDSEQKSALIKEVCSANDPTKPAASLNSSIYSSAASSSSSTSSASESTNSASSSSTSSTLSSPSQSSRGDGDTKDCGISHMGPDIDNIEVAQMEDLGKTAQILENRLALTNELRTVTNCSDEVSVTAMHSYNRSIGLNGQSSPPLTSSNISHSLAESFAQRTSITRVNSSIDTNVSSWGFEPWKTITGKRDKRRKKPVEQPVLSQHIPGHKGEQEVEWLVKFIESGPPAPGNITSTTSKKVTKNTKQQSKRLSSQTMDRERETHQRKPNNRLTIAHIRPIQQHKVVSCHVRDDPSSQAQSTIGEEAKSNDRQLQESEPRKSLQWLTNERETECKEPKIEYAQNVRCEVKAEQDEAVVTFADHIYINDEEASFNGRYIFGFFDDQQSLKNNQVEYSKPITTRLDEDPPNNLKPKRVSQKHKLKPSKPSLNSELKRYKSNDNIDANSFNYHQILEFISNSWESSAKSRRQTVKHASLSQAK